MKMTLLILLLTFCSVPGYSQNINDKLYAAVSAKDTLKTEELLKSGADANYRKKTGGFLEISVLILAVQNNDYKTTYLLVKNKAMVDWRDAFDTTALMYAASKGEKNIVLYLLKNGADINAADKQGNNVLSAAKESKNQELINIIESLMKAK